LDFSLYETILTSFSVMNCFVNKYAGNCPWSVTTSVSPVIQAPVINPFFEAIPALLTAFNAYPCGTFT